MSIDSTEHVQPVKAMWALAAGAAVATASARLDAAPCANLPNPVYIQTGDTQVNLLKLLGRALRDNTPKPITLVFFASGSCTNVQAIYTRIPITANLQYVPSIAEDPAWTAASPTLTCEPPVGTGVVPDIANSALFVSSCTTETPPATVASTFGPVQAYVMAVPKGSSQTAITYEEAYFVFGFGAAGMVEPWRDESQLFIRTITKSTLLTWAANIGVPAGKWKGTMFDKSSDVVAQLTTSTQFDKAIGILGVEVYDGLRDKLTALAFRAKGQYAAYYPDSTSTARDKRNLRDGHYTVWSPTEWLQTTDVNHVPVNPNADYVVRLIAGRSVTSPPSFDPEALVAAVGLVPDCAMSVKRSFDGGPLSLYQPAESCSCRYEFLAAGAHSCQTCDGSNPCTTGVCRAGYCEAR